MSHVHAIYRHGVFEPLEPVDLAEGKRVRLQVTASEEMTEEAWLKAVRCLQEEVIKAGGVLPDSTADIAADRMR